MRRDVADYIVCEECGFVLLSESSTEAGPRRVESCPDCGETEFRFVDS